MHPASFGPDPTACLCAVWEKDKVRKSSWIHQVPLALGGLGFIIYLSWCGQKYARAHSRRSRSVSKELTDGIISCQKSEGRDDFEGIAILGGQEQGGGKGTFHRWWQVGYSRMRGNTSIRDIQGCKLLHLAQVLQPQIIDWCLWKVKLLEITHALECQSCPVTVFTSDAQYVTSLSRQLPIRSFVPQIFLTQWLQTVGWTTGLNNACFIVYSPGGL